MQIYQQTLQDTAFFQGVGLHSGKIVDLIVSPASEDSGIRFLRSDIPDCKPIPASALLIGPTDLCTTLQTEQAVIGTVEHLMAALFGMGIDNALIQVNAKEIPILDGSSIPYIDAFQQIGVKMQSAKRQYYQVVSPFSIEVNDSVMSVEPSQKLQYDCTIDFTNSKAIGKQHFCLDFSTANFLQIADARTFCHMRDVEAMRKVGLAIGGSLDNAVVVNDQEVINAEGLRYPNEFVRHKLLDLVGDLALLGRPLIGKVTSYRGGHALHAVFMRQILELGLEHLKLVDFDSISDWRVSSKPKVAVAGLR